MQAFRMAMWLCDWAGFVMDLFCFVELGGDEAGGVPILKIDAKMARVFGDVVWEPLAKKWITQQMFFCAQIQAQVMDITDWKFCKDWIKIVGAACEKANIEQRGKYNSGLIPISRSFSYSNN